MIICVVSYCRAGSILMKLNAPAWIVTAWVPSVSFVNRALPTSSAFWHMGQVHWAFVKLVYCRHQGQVINDSKCSLPRDKFVYGLSQWETTLQYKVASRFPHLYTAWFLLPPPMKTMDSWKQCQQTAFTISRSMSVIQHASIYWVSSKRYSFKSTICRRWIKRILEVNSALSFWIITHSITDEWHEYRVWYYNTHKIKCSVSSSLTTSKEGIAEIYMAYYKEFVRGCCPGRMI